MARWAVAGSLLVTLLAGCVADAPAPTVAAPGVPVGEGTYAVEHPGGTLAVAADAPAIVDIFDPQDRRLGQLAVVPGAGASLAALDAGEYVVRILEAQGNVTLSASGRTLVARPLGPLVERVVLAQAPRDSIPILGNLVGEGAPRHLELAVDLASPPLDLRLLLDGEAGSIVLMLSSDGVPVLSADTGGPTFLALGPGLSELPAEFLRENVRGARLEGPLDVSGLEGTLVLESHSYLRAAARGLEASPARPSDIGFRYGLAPGGPVALDVAERGSSLFLVAANGSADVSLFTTTGALLGHKELPNGTAWRVAAEAAATYVLVAPAGLLVGTDVTPSDFSLRPVPVTTRFVVPRSGDGTYAEARVLLGAAEGDGIVFAASLAWSGSGVDPLRPLPCQDDVVVQLEEAGATVASWSMPAGPSAHRRPAVPLPFSSGTLQARFLGTWMPGCERAGLAVASFQPGA